MKSGIIQKSEISKIEATTIFVIATVYFFILLFTLLPFIKNNFILNPSLYWFITGTFLFVPLFVYSVVMVRKEGNKKLREIIQALNIKCLSSKDWWYTILGTLSLFLLTGAIYAISLLLNKYFGLRLLNTTPWFMEELQPFRGVEKLLLLVWFPMFFFNIVGEEILWRGYIQNRMKGKHVWIFISILWSIFHIPFGIDLIIMASPALIIIPYVFHKRDNTLISILIHGIYNGPIFVLISLGIIN